MNYVTPYKYVQFMLNIYSLLIENVFLMNILDTCKQILLNLFLNFINYPGKYACNVYIRNLSIKYNNKKSFYLIS